MNDTLSEKICQKAAYYKNQEHDRQHGEADNAAEKQRRMDESRKAVKMILGKN